jgi:catechol 2,3-dioxygenase-like lactoylglutathione lyase family enzyme
MTKLRADQPARRPNPLSKARALAYLRFERPDLEQAERFLVDFGLRVAARTDEALYLRGTEGGTPFCYAVRRAAVARFTGFGLAVGSRLDLETLAKVPGASPIERLDGPGGGERVRLVDPSGFAVDAVCGRGDPQPLLRRPALQLNTADARPRVNAAQRPASEPPQIVKLGHVVLEVARFQATCAWYAEHFGLLPSDVQVLPDGLPAVVFLRLDLGRAPADHHTLAIAQGIAPEFSHAAFEVVDVDAVAVGERVLRERGWAHAWGIGRHILGSQVFDYWCDPWDDKHEHYTDGDVFTSEVPMGVHEVSRDAMAQWGPPMPRSFTKPRLTPGKLARLVSNLRSSPDLSVDKLVTLARIFG